MSKRSYTRETEQYWLDDEIDRFFRVVRASGSVRDLAIFELAYHRGLRVSEVGMITLADYMPTLQTLFVRRLKRGYSGSFVLTDREKSAIDAWIRERGYSNGPLFPGRRGTRGISRQRLHEMVRLYATQAQLPAAKRHFHCLRHTAGTVLGEKADLVEVQDHLGHRDPRSTSVYLRVRNKRRLELGHRLKSVW